MAFACITRRRQCNSIIYAFRFLLRFVFHYRILLSSRASSLFGGSAPRSPPHPTRPLTRPRGALRIPSPALHALFTCLYRIYILFLLLLLLSNEMYVLVYSNNGSENAELENTRRGRTRALLPIEIKTGQIYRLSLDLE